MFQPDKYRKKDPFYIFNFIKAHPFATFITKENSLLATHIPILVEGDPEHFVLYGHIAAANEQYQYLKDGLEALLIFHGPQAYVSSSWYHQKDISTWDYSAVHINVKLKVQSVEELRDSLRKLIHNFEKDQENPVFYKDLPAEMIESHLPLITGFWCTPERIQAIAKLHQGFSKKDVESVTRHLESSRESLSTELSRNIKTEHGQNN